jgi:hypothetical protein
LDTLGACGAERECSQCPLQPECQGRAKQRPPGAVVGHIRIDDAIRLKARAADAAWKSEMLCLRPRRSDSVFPEFDPAVHVGEWHSGVVAPWQSEGSRATSFTSPLGHSATSPLLPAGASRRFIAGMDFGFRAPTVILLAWVDAAGIVRIEAENVESERTLEHHIGVILEGRYGCLREPGEARAPSDALLGTRYSALCPAWIGVDPAGFQRNEQTGISAITALKRAGLVVKARRLALQEGLAVISARLKSSDGSPRLFIHARCAQLIEALQRYHYPEDSPHSMEPVKDGADHLVDALRYMLVNLDRPATVKVYSYL